MVAPSTRGRGGFIPKVLQDFWDRQQGVSIWLKSWERDLTSPQ